ncbi:MAG: C40 family peptidase [Bacteroidota bacterium]|nr:C40 family peptidase [Bacteroidota bacterium]
MSFVVCVVSVAPLRSEAGHRSEMVSELLLGEFATVLEEQKDFLKIKCLYDGYEGWCQRSQLAGVENTVVASTYVLSSVATGTINNRVCTMSCATPVLSKGKEYTAGPVRISFPSAEHLADTTTLEFSEANIKKIAFHFINTPYLWGGKSAFGIDCSGFAQQVFKMMNIVLPRDAYQQAALGESVGFLEEVQCGDLAFFDNAEGRITHVGILLNASEIIHSSGSVRVDKIDHAGIIHTETGERTHNLRIIKRYKQ